MKNSNDDRKGTIARTAVLLALDIIYLALVAVSFIAGVDLAADKTMQYMLHITVILSAFAFFFFADMIYAAQEDKRDAGLARIFAALFTLPVLIGRGVGLAVISGNTSELMGSVFNFYAAISVTRSIELIAWTTLFPLSMLFLAKLFFKKEKAAALAWLCLLSAICCFIAFMTFFSSNSIYLFIGITGWGILFLTIVIIYFSGQIREYRAARKVKL